MKARRGSIEALRCWSEKIEKSRKFEEGIQFQEYVETVLHGFWMDPG
jgi:hypothetical protein